MTLVQPQNKRWESKGSSMTKQCWYEHNGSMGVRLWEKLMGKHFCKITRKNEDTNDARGLAHPPFPPVSMLGRTNWVNADGWNGKNKWERFWQFNIESGVRGRAASPRPHDKKYVCSGGPLIPVVNVFPINFSHWRLLVGVPAYTQKA